MKLREHRPLRSNWAIVHNAPVGSGRLSRSEIVRNVRAANKRAEIFDNFRAKFARPTRRVANVRKVNGGFHVIGLGHQPLTLNELKVKLAVKGNSAFRIGGLTFSV